MENKNIEPGVSGKSANSTWINPKEYQDQKHFVEDAQYSREEDPRVRDAAGTEHGLFGRNDVSNQGDAPHDHNFVDVIYDALRKSPEADISNVQITAADGVVTLEGEVMSHAEIRVLENLITNIRGVREVKNNLEVHLDQDISGI
jgi:osmotically-inducible protein OsmY